MIRWLHTKASVILEYTNLNEWYREFVIDYIDKRIDAFCENGSGWMVNRIVKLAVVMLNYEPFKGSSYIELPKQIFNKRATINVKNSDQKCFMWSVLAALHEAPENPNQVRHYEPYENELNFGDLEFPIKASDIDIFEKLNPGIAINLHKLRLKNNNYTVNPCRQSKKNYLGDKNIKLIDLLILQNYYKDEGLDDVEIAKLDFLPVDKHVDIDSHYVLITSLERLLNAQISSDGHKINMCNRCYTRFGTEEKLAAHTPNCGKINGFTRVEMPKENCGEDILYFKNHKHKLKIPYVIYADFETVLRPSTDASNTTHEHEAFSVGYYIKCSFDDSQSVYRSYRMTNENQMSPAAWFVHELSSIANRLEAIYKAPKKMIITEEQQKEFEKTSICYICKRVSSRQGQPAMYHRSQSFYSQVFDNYGARVCGVL
uniref:Uncharacterized protein n=1 Tax=Trichogramma kaykai TaxID=54128 RepID=A0ABD2W704_9HYME